MVIIIVLLLIMNPPGPDQLVILGGGLTPTGYPSGMTFERVERAVQQYDSFGSTLVVCSGGVSWMRKDANNKITEAEVMAELAHQKGIPEDIIATEGASNNTLTNIVCSAALLDPEQSVGYVTHGFHMPRTLMIARRVMPQTTELFGVRAPQHYLRALPAEARSFVLAEAVLRGVCPGDTQTILDRTTAMQNFFLGVKQHIVHKKNATDDNRLT